MKLFILFIFGFLLLSPNVSADTLDLEDEAISFIKPVGYNLQGFTIVNNNLFLVLNNNDTKAIIRVYDLTNKNMVTEFNYYNLGHANDVTYNSKENIIYVLKSGGDNTIHLFDGTTFKFIKDIESDKPLRSLTYIDKMDAYAGRVVTTGFMFDKDFKLKSEIPFISAMNVNRDIARQGWSYYKDYIYYANWSWKRYGGDGINLIEVYDLSGKLVNTLYTNNDIGELEGVDFYKNTMVLGFNGYDDHIKFYYSDVPDIKEVKVSTEPSNNKDNDNKENDYNPFLLLIPISQVIIMYIIFSLAIKKK